MIFNCLFNIFVFVIIVCEINGLPTTYKNPPYERKPYLNPGYVEGDMIYPSVSQSDPTSRIAIRRGTPVPWPNGIVPYTFLDGFDPSQQAFIVRVMNEMERVIAINNVACIQFRPQIPSDQNYIAISNGDGCSSTVGALIGEGINNSVSLNYPGCFQDALVMHELLHTIGMQHEQSRPDRDNYVKVNYQNIDPSEFNNFEKYDSSLVDTLNTPYDYASVMHYGAYDFSTNGLPAIEPLQNVTIGQRYNMSTLDILAVQVLYNCSANGITLPPMPTTTTVNLYVANVTIALALTATSETFFRPSSTVTCYYQAFQVTVPVDGDYIFTSNSSIDTVGYLYKDNFYANSSSINVFAVDDDSGGNLQFKITAYLRANRRYILVATTAFPLVTGPYILTVYGANTINLLQINSSSIVSTTTTTTASPPNITWIMSSYSGALSTNSHTYDRFGGFGLYYYEAIMLTLPIVGTYVVGSNSSINTYGYLYLNSFDPLNLEKNLVIGDDNSGDNSQFLMSGEFGYAKTYVLVVTTYDQAVIGPFTILVAGPQAVTFKSLNITSTTTTITTSPSTTTMTTTSSSSTTKTSTTTSLPSTTGANSTIRATTSSASTKFNFVMIELLIYLLCTCTLYHFI